MNTIDQLFESISAEAPVVDNPAGLMHNYMARKPYNTVRSVICALSPENGFVYDPMAGSGTTVIEAAKAGRHALGADVNPIANLIAKTTLTKWDLNKLEALIDGYMKDLESLQRKIYGITVNETSCVIERCHFGWNGNELQPEEYWYKPIKSQGGYSSRKKATAGKDFCELYHDFANAPIKHIENRPLIPNSRIAIPEGRSVYDYFCNRNIVFLDAAKGLLEERSNDYGYDVLRLLFSSAINLVKISDKKASSQIPFWIPKRNVTSRNGYFVFQKKAKAILEGLKYCNQELVAFYNDNPACLCGAGTYVNCYLGGAQNIPADCLPAASVDLIVTDPPYTDQVPYVEYGQLTAAVMDIDIDNSLQDELVVSDAPSRNKTSEDFNAVFEQIMERSYLALKDDGYLAMFYHSFDLKSWDSILTMMRRAGYSYVDQIAIAAPRKSFKTVMSPGKTLDGNYLIIFRKRSGLLNPVFEGGLQEAERLAISKAREIATGKSDSTLQTIYDEGLLKDSIENGYLHVLAAHHKTFATIMESALNKGTECTGC